MKELKIYLNFFNKNWKIILFFGFIGLLLSFLFLNNSKVLYKSELLFQLEHNDENVERKKLEADELVGVLRGGQISQLIKDSDVQQLDVYKPGPVSIIVVISGDNKTAVSENSARVEDFVFSQSNTRLLSSNESVIESKKGFILLVGLIIGLIVGILIGLFKNYARNY